MHEFLYDGVHLKFRGERAMAFVFFNSFSEANAMVQELDGQKFYGKRVEVRHCAEGMVLMVRVFSNNTNFIVIMCNRIQLIRICLSHF